MRSRTSPWISNSMMMPDFTAQSYRILSEAKDPASAENILGRWRSLRMTFGLEVRAEVETKEGSTIRTGPDLGAEERAVDEVAGVRVVPVHDFESGERADGRARDDVARPVFVLEHP